jgi:cytoskeleton protein RodZ
VPLATAARANIGTVTPMPGIGETLREARMRQHLDIADVERQTKIRTKYLRALENEEFSMLPGPTFVKTFLRTYAELLGLDPHALVEEYRARHETRDELETLQPLGPPSRQSDRRGGPPRFWIVALLVAAAVVAGLVALGLSTDEEPSDDRAGATTTETAPRTERTETTREEQPAAPRRVAVRVTPSTPTYVCVDTGAGTEVTFEGTLDAARTFRGRRLRFNIGKSLVDVRVNGRKVAIEPGPDPVGFAFTPGGTRPLPLGQRPCA